MAQESEVLLVGVGGIARCLAGEQAVAGTIVERDGGSDLGHVARAHDAVFGRDDLALVALAVHGNGLDDRALVHGDGAGILAAALRRLRAVGGIVEGCAVGGRLQLHRQRAGVGARCHGERRCFGQEHVGYLHLVGGSGHLAHAAVVVVADGNGLQRHRVVHGDGRGVLRAAGRGLRAVGGVVDGHVGIGRRDLHLLRAGVGLAGIQREGRCSHLHRVRCGLRGDVIAPLRRIGRVGVGTARDGGEGDGLVLDVVGLAAESLQVLLIEEGHVTILVEHHGGVARCGGADGIFRPARVEVGRLVVVGRAAQHLVVDAHLLSAG